MSHRNVTEASPAVEKSVFFLASVCDKARARDDSGFSKATASPGHELAALGSARWTEEMWSYAGRLAAHHSKQLLSAGAIDATEFSELQTLASKDLKSPKLPTNWADLSDIDGNPAVAVSISFSKPLARSLERLAADQAFRPAGHGKLWRISSRFAFALAPFADEIDYLDPQAKELVAVSEAQASSADRLLIHLGPILKLADGCITFRMEYDGALYAQMKTLGGGRIEVGNSWSDVLYTVAPDRRGHAFLELFMARGFNAAFEDGVLEEFRRIAGVEPFVEPPKPFTEPKLEIIYAEGAASVDIRFVPFNQSWLEAVKSLSKDDRSWVEGVWRVDARRPVLEQLADLIRGCGDQRHHARAAGEIDAFLSNPSAFSRPASDV